MSIYQPNKPTLSLSIVIDIPYPNWWMCIEYIVVKCAQTFWRCSGRHKSWGGISARQVFQCLVIFGENAGPEALRNAEQFVITDDEFDAFIVRHRSLDCLVPESNDVMRYSYIIVDERVSWTLRSHVLVGTASWRRKRAKLRERENKKVTDGKEDRVKIKRERERQVDRERESNLKRYSVFVSSFYCIAKWI